MDLTLIIIFSIFGLIIGSFLNVVVCRYHTARSFQGRSACMSCSKQLCWYDMVPILSFFILKGRCRHCKSRFSWQYPLVELSSGIMFAMLFYKFQSVFWMDTFLFTVSFAFYVTFFAVLLAISAYDLKHKIIPDAMVFAVIIISFVGLFVFKDGIFVLHFPTTWEFLTGPLSALPFAFLWFISKGTWMGFGDAKLMLALGWILGPTRILPGLMVAFGAGFVFGVVMLLASKRYHLKTEIPFAPFLVAGTLLATVFDLSFIMQFFSL